MWESQIKSRASLLNFINREQLLRKLKQMERKMIHLKGHMTQWQSLIKPSKRVSVMEEILKSPSSQQMGQC